MTVINGKYDVGCIIHFGDNIIFMPSFGNRSIILYDIYR